MDELGYHLNFRAEDSRVLAPDVAAQRRVAEVLHAVGEGYGLLAFRAAGDHLHVAAACDRTEAGKLARSVAGQLTQRLALPGFLPAHFTPCRDQRHLEEVFFYVLRNAEKHGVSNDPTHEASSVGALLGMRVAPGPFLARVRRAVPALDRDLLLAIVGVRALDPLVSLPLLADAAAGAVGAVALDQSRLATAARIAAVHLGLRTASPAAVAEALDMSERSIRRHREADADAFLLRAIGLRMGLRVALGDRARVDLPVPTRREWRRGRAALEASARGDLG
jgi:hypothetical protein